jgi:hypothetical protein
MPASRTPEASYRSLVRSIDMLCIGWNAKGGPGVAAAMPGPPGQGRAGRPGGYYYWNPGAFSPGETKEWGNQG